MVILVDSFIAAHRVQHENVEIDFLSILCVPAPSEWGGGCRNIEDFLSCRKGGGQQWAFSRCFADGQN